MSPDHSSVGLAMPVLIRGSHLTEFAVANYRDPHSSRVESAAFTLNGYELLNLQVVTENEVSAIVPPFPAEGALDLVATDHFGRQAVAAAAFTIRAGSCEDYNSVGGTDCTACASGGECGCSEQGYCVPLCGNGRVFPPETCDDGNYLVRDGCDEECAVEPGYRCEGHPSSCAPICGDANKMSGEACDDGNEVGGDGCSAHCEIEDGFVCTDERHARSSCATVCGDGFGRGAEACDDGNNSSGDGCNATCAAIEAHWECPAAGGACDGLCGDGILLGSESCEDGNSLSGDGCDEQCRGEVGWSCTPGQVCVQICGDGIVVGTEQCDDGNITSGDGCSANCTSVEVGFACGVQGCAPVCGDDRRIGAEECDDGNLIADDGCSDGCELEPGWSCSAAGCQAICGDAVHVGTEACDDGNLAADDGCSATCTLEQGYRCDTPGAACTPVCGDGLMRGYETCDDGNSVSGDGCGNYCFVEVSYTCTGQPSRCTAGSCQPIVRASLSTTGEQANGEQGQFSLDLSEDGRFVAWASTGNNVVPGDSNGFWDVFVRDVTGGATQMVSISSAGVFGNNDSGNIGNAALGSAMQEVSISGDGRYVAFISRASNLVAGDTNGVADVFLRDRVAATTIRISNTSTGGQAAPGVNHTGADNVVVSQNGRFIAFSTWSALMPSDTNGVVDVYVYDRLNQTIDRATLGTLGNEGTGSLYLGQISLDGRYLTFDGNSPGIVPNINGGLFLRDRVLKTTELVSRASGPNGTAAASACCGDISVDGRYIAFQSSSALVADDTNAVGDVYLRDRLTATTTRLSVDVNGQQATSVNDSGPFSRNASMSADGRYVTFHSPCFLDPAHDQNGPLSDIYVRDLFTNTIYLASKNAAGMSANGGSVRPRMSNNGWYLTFESGADDLVLPDVNRADIYRPMNCAP